MSGSPAPGAVERPPTAWWQRPAIIVAGAAMIRLAWALVVPVEPVSDSALYRDFALSIASGKGYAYPAGNLTVYWPVGTSAVYAVLYQVSGGRDAAIVAFNVLLGSSIVGLTWRFARHFMDPAGAAVAAWLTAAWPVLIQFTTILASELLFIALVLAALNVWVSDGWPALRRAVLWGACIAAATYVRPTAWPLLFLFPLAGWLVERRLRNMLLTLAISTSVAAVLFAPWVQRNYALFDRFVLVAANSGPNLWMGNNPRSDGGYMQLPDRAFANEVERDDHYRREAVAFIVGHPLTYLRLCVDRTITTYSRESIGVAWNQPGLTRSLGAWALVPLKIVSSMYWWAVLLLALAGAATCRRDGTRYWPLFLVTAFVAVVPVLTVAQDRYHLPVDPFLAIFAAMAVANARSRPPAAH